MRNKAKKRNKNKDNHDLNILEFYFEFKNYKFIILICSLIGFIFGIVFDKSNQKDEIKITLYSPEVENFIIYEQPFVSQQEYTNSLTEFFVSNNEWEDKNALDFKEDEYENNITSEKISKNNFKLNKIYSHKVKLSYVIDKKKYN